MDPFYFAAIGDVHGHIKQLLRHLSKRAAERPLSALLQVGDFEPHRSLEDVALMDAPQKYRQLGEFHLLAQGKLALPAPLYFIGGNHEPYGWLDSLAPMTLVAPDCTWIGRVGSFNLQGLRITGVSGIEVEGLRAQRGERPAERIGVMDDEVMAALERGPADILMIHEWPAGIHRMDGSGKRRTQGEVGSPLLRSLVDLLRPQWVICGHMHAPYRATLEHEFGTTEVVCLPHVAYGPESIALFRWQEGVIQEVR